MVVRNNVLEKAALVVLVSLQHPQWAAWAKSNNIAIMGLCETVATGKKRCAMRESYCNNPAPKGETWRSGYEEQNLACVCETTSIGACVTVSGTWRCAVSEEVCEPTEFFLLGKCGCDHIYTGAKDNNDSSPKIPTGYGACQNLMTGNSFCAIMPDQCEGEHVWVRPRDTMEVIGKQCTCANTRTGGCLVDGKAICAIDETSCEELSSYYTPLQLKKTLGYSCFLCDAETTNISPPAADEIDQIHVSRTATTGSSGSSKPGLILGVLLAIAIVFAVLSFVFYKTSQRAKEAVQEAVQEAEKDLQLHENNNNNDNDDENEDDNDDEPPKEPEFA